ncbi:MAG: glycosyl hydrolase, partial [Clostridia bacterium]|nr:glycosyl hydrolase [Clostridia bacterium]
MIDEIKALIEKMTLEEKASLCSGYDFWSTKPIKRLGIPSVSMSDGPHGLRKENDDDESIGIKTSFPATAFPPAVNIASSWSVYVAKKLGDALGKQCLDQDVSVILGPGTNIKRSPICGRNFEYLSEDPYLAGKLSRNYIEGVQSNGVGTSLKHFCANNQE